MPLTAGTKLGPYQVLGELGAGGMGEVYRARDTRLNRTVAIKILPEHLSSDPGRRARFEREARTISGLSHPNICALFDIGDQGGVYYVVLEYLEGKTLADRIAKGPMPVSEVLKVGADIASALETAHRYGIVHRDLKPANVMLTKTGAKLLDFGLAKPSAALAPAAAGDAPTVSKSLTEEGVIVGTFRYMAPEQLEGKETDGRTDIFALGALLYEMGTARSAFTGASRASIIAAILSSEPEPISGLQPLFPPALDHVVHTCLAKDPDERWQTAHDVRLQLEWIRDAGSQTGVPRVTARRPITRKRIAWASAAFLLLAVAAMLVMRFLQPSARPQPKIMFSVEPPPGYQVSEPEIAVALSPDGGRIAYAVTDSKGKDSLWVRAFDSLSPRRLEGSESSDEYSPTWTPDGKAVIAAADKKLVRLSATGGANEVLCETFDGLPSTINREGTILAWTAPPTRIISVSADDYCALHYKSPYNGTQSDVAYAYPHFLPDGDHFLFAAIRKDKHHEVLLGSLGSSKTQVLIRNGSYPKYISAGYILFSRDGFLMAQKFDEKSKSTSGEAFLAYPNQLAFEAAFGWAAFDASRNGTITAEEQAASPMLLRWCDRSGQVLKTLGEPEYATTPRLDAQETHLLLDVYSPRTHAGDIWSLDLEHGTKRRESFQDRSGTGWSTWTAEGGRIVYSVLVGTQAEMFIKTAGSSDNGKMIQTGLDGSKIISDVSPDGNWILYQDYNDSGAEPANYGQSLIDGKRFLIGPAAADELPRFSPDGGWVAVPSNESGSVEIVVRPFAPGAAGGGTQVSFDGGHDPRWSRDGKELFYRTNNWHVVAVPVVDLKQHRFGKPVTLFQLKEGAEYDVVDGKRFLVNEPVGPASAPLFVIANWKLEPPKSE